MSIRDFQGTCRDKLEGENTLPTRILMQVIVDKIQLMSRNSSRFPRPTIRRFKLYRGADLQTAGTSGVLRHESCDGKVHLHIEPSLELY